MTRRLAWQTLLVMVFLVLLTMSDFALPGLHDRLGFGSVEMAKLLLLRTMVLVALPA